MPSMSSSVHSSKVRSHAKSLRAMANPSAVWAHFDLCINDPLRAQCRICESVVVRGGANPRQCGTTNLHRHLRVHHGGRLVGRRYVTESNNQETSGNISLRLRQSMARQMQHAQKKQQQQQQQYNQPQPQHHQHHQQQQQQEKNNVSKQINEISPPIIKMQQIQPPSSFSPPILHPQQSTEVCLRWNSYHSNMQTSFPSLLDTEQFVDVTLACEGRSIKCHKMILSSCSDYLAGLLRDNPCQHPIIFMKDLKYWEVEALVNFMYRGEVNVSHDKLPELLNAAEALQVKGLAEPNLQNQKSTNSMPKYVHKNIHTKDIKQKKIDTTLPALPKMTKIPNESTESPRVSSKIRIRRSSILKSKSPVIKTEPLDIPLSPNDIHQIDKYHDDNYNDEDDDYNDDYDDNENDNVDCKNIQRNYKNLETMNHVDNYMGEFNDDNINYHELPNPPDINNDDQMEFVPTDFLEQQQSVIDDTQKDNEINDNYGDDDDEDDDENVKSIVDDRKNICKQENVT